MRAAVTDCLVLGLGATDFDAMRDAARHGAEDASLLEFWRIEVDAAKYVEGGGDCRGLTFDLATDTISLRKEARQ